MEDAFKRGHLALWLLVIPVWMLLHSPASLFAAQTRTIAPPPKPFATRATVVSVAATPTPTPSPTPIPTATPVPAITWRDNPQHCNLNTQLISLTPPFNCVPRPTPTPQIATASVSGGLHDWYSAAGIPAAVWWAVDYIVAHESGGRITATNPSSGAYGLCQALPGYKMASAGADWATNPVTQLRWCNSYAQERYGGWAGAYAHWTSHRWW